MPVSQRDSCEMKRPSQRSRWLQHPVRQPVQHQRMQARITREHLPRAARGRIAVEDALDVGTQAGEHGVAVIWLWPRSLSFYPRRAASAMALATPRRMWISSGVELRPVEQLVQPRHQLLGRGRIEEADVHQRLLPVRQHARPRPAHRPAPASGARGATGESAQRRAPFVGDHLDRRGQVERSVTPDRWEW